MEMSVLSGKNIANIITNKWTHSQALKSGPNKINDEL